MSTLGNVFFGKESEKPSEEKPVEKPSEEKPVEKSSGEKPNEQPHPKPKPKPIRFHCGYCGRDGHRTSFASRGSERREWRRSGLKRIGTTLPWCTRASYATAQGQGGCEKCSGMGRCEFSQPRWCSGEGGQTDPAQRGRLDRPG
jgi:hypothetical protein